jgi:hypothetical protein
MDIMRISESVKTFLKTNKDNLQKKYSEAQIREGLNLLDDYTTRGKKMRFFLTPINIIQMQDNVEAKIKEAKEETKEQESKQSEESDDDIKNLFDEK